MARGSTGTNTGTIIYRRQNPVACDCSKCRNQRIVDGQAICMTSGDYLSRPKKRCLFYSGPYIHTKKKHTKAVAKKVKSKKPIKKALKKHAKKVKKTRNNTL